MRTRMLTAALILTLLLPGSGRLLEGTVSTAAEHSPHGTSVAGAPVTPAAGESRPVRSDDELRLLKSLVDRGAAASALADQCRARAVHPELHGLCDEIVAGANADLAALETWIEDWYRRPYEPDQGGAVPATPALAGEFEAEFLISMQRENEATIAIAREGERQAGHPELAEHCRRTIARKTAENERLRAWLCAWHGECGEGQR